LIPPQNVSGVHEKVDSFMRPAPHANADETQYPEDAMVLDPLSNEVVDLWQGTARKNRDIFTEIFRPVPSDLVRTWDAYKVRWKNAHWFVPWDADRGDCRITPGRRRAATSFQGLAWRV
jgi:hypothetical protein